MVTAPALVAPLLCHDNPITKLQKCRSSLKYLMKKQLTINLMCLEEGHRAGAAREDPLSDGHLGEGLLWSAVH